MQRATAFHIPFDPKEHKRSAEDERQRQKSKPNPHHFLRRDEGARAGQPPNTWESNEANTSSNNNNANKATYVPRRQGSIRSVIADMKRQNALKDKFEEAEVAVPKHAPPPPRDMTPQVSPQRSRPVSPQRNHEESPQRRNNVKPRREVPPGFGGGKAQPTQQGGDAQAPPELMETQRPARPQSPANSFNNGRDATAGVNTAPAPAMDKPGRGPPQQPQGHDGYYDDSAMDLDEYGAPYQQHQQPAQGVRPPSRGAYDDYSSGPPSRNGNDYGVPPLQGHRPPVMQGYPSNRDMPHSARVGGGGRGGDDTMPMRAMQERIRELEQDLMYARRGPSAAAGAGFDTVSYQVERMEQERRDFEEYMAREKRTLRRERMELEDRLHRMSDREFHRRDHEEIDELRATVTALRAELRDKDQRYRVEMERMRRRYQEVRARNMQLSAQLQPGGRGVTARSNTAGTSTMNDWDSPSVSHYDPVYEDTTVGLDDDISIVNDEGSRWEEEERRREAAEEQRRRSQEQLAEERRRLEEAERSRIEETERRRKEDAERKTELERERLEQQRRDQEEEEYRRRQEQIEISERERRAAAQKQLAEERRMEEERRRLEEDRRRLEEERQRVEEERRRAESERRRIEEEKRRKKMDDDRHRRVMDEERFRRKLLDEEDIERRRRGEEERLRRREAEESTRLRLRQEKDARDRQEKERKERERASVQAETTAAVARTAKPPTTTSTSPPIVPSLKVPTAAEMRRSNLKEEDAEADPQENVKGDSLVETREHNDGKVERVFRSSKREIVYGNGTTKVMLPSGHVILRFNNGDVKTTFPSGKSIYWYALARTTHVQYPSGLQVFEFQATNQIERHHADGKKEILFSNGTYRRIHLDGSEEEVSPRGTVTKVDPTTS
eukprot:PhM_4_TR810/c0_g4_i1/m.62904/K11502/CENPJ; centromere protein J